MVYVKKRPVQNLVEQLTKYTKEMHGATICSDGCSNVRIRSLINMMLVCHVEDVFLGSVDTIGRKTYIANKMALDRSKLFKCVQTILAPC